jgi:hypothetical protein
MALGLALSDGKVSKLAESLVVAMSCVAQYALPNLFESASNAAKRPCQRINERSCCSWHEATQLACFHLNHDGESSGARVAHALSALKRGDGHPAVTRQCKGGRAIKPSLAILSEGAHTRIALIADTHLSPRPPECVANWHAVRRAVGRLLPGLKVNLSDITLDGQTHAAELEFAVQLVRQWAPPCCVPGNHDVGDASGESPLDASLLAAYVDLFGPDHWAQCAGN